MLGIQQVPTITAAVVINSSREHCFTRQLIPQSMLMEVAKALLGHHKTEN